MEFVVAYAGVAGFIKILYKSIHQNKKTVFMYIIVGTIQPADMISSKKFIM